MKALKVIAEGPVASFRYPHFAQGVHLTYDMPPPATIYGHICSAVGSFIPPESTQFAYTFTYEAKFFDYEHLHFFYGKGTMNPFRRELLFRPRLTLYLSDISLEDYFVNPHYAVVLGRAQDLMTYVHIGIVELEQVDQTFYENTLLNLNDAATLGGRTYAVTMPRFINESRVPMWGQYAVLKDTIDYPGEYTLRTEDDTTLSIWVDPEPDASHPYKPLQRGVVWHKWV